MHGAPPKSESTRLDLRKLDAVSSSIAGTFGQYLGASLFAEHYIKLNSTDAKAVGVSTVFAVALPKMMAKLGGRGRQPKVLTGRGASRVLKAVLAGAGAGNNIFFTVESFAKFFYDESVVCLDFSTIGPWALVVSVGAISAYGFRANFQMGVTGIETLLEQLRSPDCTKWPKVVYPSMFIFGLWSAPGRVSIPANFLKKLAVDSALSWCIGVLTYIGPTLFTVSESIKLCQQKPKTIEAMHMLCSRNKDRYSAKSICAGVVLGFLFVFLVGAVLFFATVAGMPNTGTMANFMATVEGAQLVTGGLCQAGNASAHNITAIHPFSFGAFSGQALRALPSLDGLAGGVALAVGGKVLSGLSGGSSEAFLSVSDDRGASV